MLVVCTDSIFACVQRVVLHLGVVLLLSVSSQCVQASAVMCGPRFTYDSVHVSHRRH